MIVWVQSAPERFAPHSWGGALPRILGEALCPAFLGRRFAPHSWGGGAKRFAPHSWGGALPPNDVALQSGN